MTVMFMMSDMPLMSSEEDRSVRNDLTTDSHVAIDDYDF